MAKLGEVCLINPKSCTLRDDTEVSFIPMTKVGEHGEFDASEIKNYSEVKKGFTNFQNGDILFAKITPCMENGKGAIAHNMKNGIGFGSTEFHVLRPDTDKITSEWLYYLTTWKAFRKEAERNMTGSAGQKRVPKTFLENYVVNLPDIDTQKSENKILRKVDDLIFLRKQQLAKLDELVKVRFVEMFGDFEFNPKEFPVYHLCELCDVGSSKRIYQEEQSISGIPFLKVADLNELIDTGKYSCSTFIPLERYEQLLHKELTPTENDILITSRGTLGKCYIVQSDDEFYFQDGMISWLSNFSPKVSSIYISYLFAQPYIQKQIESLQAGSTVAYLSIAMLKKINVILPPKKLQDDFATFVEHVDQQKQTVQQSLEKLELMKKALMQEYFG
ncbi:MAG: restriction endonuclease subunit S [Faecalibacterium sp.]